MMMMHCLAICLLFYTHFSRAFPCDHYKSIHLRQGYLHRNSSHSILKTNLQINSMKHSTLSKSEKKSDKEAASFMNVHEIISDAPKNPKYQYYVQLEFASIGIIGYLRISFYESMSSQVRLAIFESYQLGLIIGFFFGAGNAWLEIPVSQMMIEQWKAQAQLNVMPIACNVNLWGMAGERVGNLLTGGIGLALGASFGYGLYDS
jgi:hypothetical protein